MKKFSLLLAAMLLCLFCLPALATDVPLSTKDIPGMAYMPETPRIVRIKTMKDVTTITLDRELSGASEMTLLAVNGALRKLTVTAKHQEDTVYTAVLPEGAQWTGIEITRVGGANAVARYSMAGGYTGGTRFDGSGNAFLFDGSGRFVGFSYADGLSVRFDSNGLMTRYGYKALPNTLVWFNRKAEVVRAEYADGVMSAEWTPSTGWYVQTPNGKVSISLNADPTAAAPLLPPDENAEDKEPEVIWYTNNTIGLAGLKLQEASAQLPNKWYNMVPIDLTVEGRQVFDLVITDASFIGTCYVDVYGDEVTVSYDLIENPEIDVKAHYGRWFTSLSDITAQSIEAFDEAIPFGEALSISEDLNGAEVAMLFIRSKATYRQPFTDGSMLSAYFRNKPDWKEFRQELTNLMPRMAK